MEYITIEDNSITGHFCGNEPKEKTSIQIMEVTNWYGAIGNDIRLYNTSTWIKRPLKDLITEGLLLIPEKQKLSEDGTSFVDMSEAEQVEAGFITLKSEQKLQGGFIVNKTHKELFDDGLISASDYNRYIDILRQSAYAHESDPLYMQVARGDVTENEWLSKIAEIKAQYPKV